MMKISLLLVGAIWLLCAGLALGARAAGQGLHNDVLAFSSDYTLGLIDVSHGMLREAARIGALPYSDVVWSPDGSQIAYESYTTYPDGSYTGAVYLVDVPTFRTHRAPVDVYGQISGLTWSPDGKRIAFALRTGDQANIDVYVSDARSGDLTNLSHNSASNVSPVWSPDSQWVAFSTWRWKEQSSQHTRRAGYYQVYLASATGDTIHRVTDDPAFSDVPVWSPDMRSIAFAGSNPDGTSDLYLMDVASGTVRRVTDLGTRIAGAAWSPDGTRIAVVSSDLGFTMYLLDVRTLALRRLAVHWGIPFISLVWSPDGSWLAFIGGQTWDDVYVVDADTGTMRNLSQDTDPEFAVGWMP